MTIILYWITSSLLIITKNPHEPLNFQMNHTFFPRFTQLTTDIAIYIHILTWISYDFYRIIPAMQPAPVASLCHPAASGAARATASAACRRFPRFPPAPRRRHPSSGCLRDFQLRWVSVEKLHQITRNKRWLKNHEKWWSESQWGWDDIPFLWNGK